MLVAQGGPAPLTLEQALVRARQAAPEVRLAQSLVEEARAGRVGQGVIFPTNPRLFGDYRRLAGELAGQPVDPRDGFNIGLDGQVEVSGVWGTRLAEADRRVELARAELEVEQARAAARAYLAFVRVQLLRQLVDDLEDILDVEKRVRDATEERLEAGVVGEPDLTLVVVEVASVRASLLEARRRVEQEQVALADVLDVPTAQVAETAPIELGPPPALELSPLLARALEKRTDLRPLRAELKLTDAQRDRLLREIVPRLGYSVGLDAAPASPSFAFVGLSVEVPVAQRNQGPLAQANARTSTTRLRLETLLRRVERQVSAARTSFSLRREQAQILETVAIPAAKRTQSLVEEGWRAGRFDVFRLTTATRESLRVRQQWLTALESAWEDYIQLELASGGLAP